jgi:hypothetical protein
VIPSHEHERYKPWDYSPKILYYKEHNMTDQVNEKKIIEDFRKRRMRQIIIAIPMIIGMITFFVISENRDFSFAGISSLHISIGIIVLFVAAAVFSIKNWRCPACNKYLGKGINPKFCPKCGARLQ